MRGRMLLPEYRRSKEVGRVGVEGPGGRVTPGVGVWEIP